MILKEVYFKYFGRFELIIFIFFIIAVGSDRKRQQGFSYFYTKV